MKVGLVQINNDLANQCYFPYSVGLLQAYLTAHSKRASELDFLSPVFTRLPVDTAINQLMSADIVLCSIYVWNERLTLAIAKKLKELKPTIKFIFGGPQVPDKSERWMLDNPFVDIAVHGEGEVILKELVDRLESDWYNVPSISFRREGKIVQNVKGPRLKDINVIPSPYLTGVFERLMEQHKDTQWVAVWESNRGCPFSCTFCDWGSATQNKMNTFELGRLHQEIDWFASKKIDFVFCCDSNFGLLQRDVDITKYFVETRQRTGFPKYLSVQNTKNATERSYSIQKMLSDSGFNKGVTIAMQSTNPQTLKNIKRDNISIKSFQEIQRRFIQNNVETYTELIIGLPGETYDTFTSSVSDLMDNGQHNRVKFNILSILPNAEMGDEKYQQKFGIVTTDTDIINLHGVSAESEVLERQKLVIATDSMPKEDWVRTTSFCWMVSLLYFDKLMQVPMLVSRHLFNKDFKSIIESLMGCDNLEVYPTISWVKDFFINRARDIQNGSSEHFYSKEFLDIHWTADELCLILLLSSGKVDALYREVFDYICASTKASVVQKAILEDAFNYNRQVIKMPFQYEDVVIKMNFNIPVIFKQLVAGQQAAFPAGEYQSNIIKSKEKWHSWDDFCREVIWYGGKRGAFLHSDNTPITQI